MQENEIDRALKQCASETLNSLVAHQLRVYVNAELQACMDLGFDPRTEPSVGLSEAVGRIRSRVEAKVGNTLSAPEIQRKSQEVLKRLNSSLADGTWRSTFRGRDILKLFAGRYLLGLPYEAFRDQILARMGDDRFQPIGMQKVINSILGD